MIRFFIYSLLALSVGAVLSMLLGEDPGYVLVSYRNYSVETSLLVVVFLLLVLLVVSYALVWILNVLNPLQFWRARVLPGFNSRRKARQATERGLQLLGQGRTHEAYKLLLQNARHMDSPLMSYLAAALAAYHEGDRNSCLYTLEQAQQACPEAHQPVEILKALLEWRTGYVEQSLAMLLELRRQQPANRYLLFLIKDMYISLGDWEHLGELLQDLEKQTRIDEEELHELHVKVGTYRLEQAGRHTNNPQALENAWGRIPKKYRQNETLQLTYLEKLIDCGEQAKAMALLARSLKQSWSDERLALMGYMDNGDPDEMLAWLEKWEKDKDDNAVLALTMGRVSMRGGRWDKAREYFEKALRFAQDDALAAEINAELARLLEHLGEHERSTACYQQALGMMEKSLPALPMPSALESQADAGEEPGESGGQGSDEKALP